MASHVGNNEGRLSYTRARRTRLERRYSSLRSSVDPGQYAFPGKVGDLTLEEAVLTTKLSYMQDSGSIR